MAYNLGEIDPEEPTGIYADPREEEEGGPPPRRLMRLAGALLVMGVFAGGLWFAYDIGLHRAGGAAGNTGDIPLIRADAGPMKVKPANPGGMPVPARDMLIYGGQRPQVEHLLPPPEQPMARPAPPPMVPNPLPPAQSAVANPPPPAAPDAAAGAGPEIADAASSPAPAAGAASPAKPPAAKHSPTKAGKLRLQLGSVRSADAARGEWERLKRDNHDLLGSMSAVAIRADLGDKGVYYRIQAGPIADASTADRICGELRQRRLPCIIVR
jgi:hypothetical protein